MEELVGRRVKKRFRGFGTFTGVVRTFDRDSGFFKVVYEDGDKEELDKDEIASFLVENDGVLGENYQKRGRKRGLGEGEKENGELGDLEEKEGVESEKIAPLEEEDGKKLDFDVEMVEKERNKGEVGTPGGGEVGEKKRRRLSETPVRRSARRAAREKSGVSNEKFGSNKWGGSEDKLGSDGDVSDRMPVEEVVEVSKPELPPSSKNPDLDGLAVLDVFSVYSCLRSFSTLLFLSPFSLEAFVGSLRCNFANSLIDSMHYSILQALKVHLEHLSEEGVQSASNCLRSLNWGLLDLVTWPVYLVEYLLLHSSSMRPSFKLYDLKLFDGEYYKQPSSVKLEILRCLCDDVLEVKLVRSEIKRRVLEVDSEMDDDQRKASEYTSNDPTLNDLENSDTDGEVVDDPNSDECCLCKMEGSLVCCDGCPAAFHSRCVGMPRGTLPEGDWYCPECVIRKADTPVNLSKQFSGAKLLGIDIHGRLFFGCWGFLLVSDSCDSDSFYYYNKNDIKAIVEVLTASSRAIYADIITAFSTIWGIPNVQGDEISKMTKNNPETRDSLPGDCSPSRCLVIIKQPSISPTAGASENGVNFPANCVSLVKMGTPSSTNDQTRSWVTHVQHESNGYLNYYSFGRIASSIAEEIASKSLDVVDESSSNSINDLKSAQLDVITKQFIYFGWSVVQKLSLDAQKERCGWCLSCKSPEGEDCLLNAVESRFLEGSKNTSFGLRSVKNRKSHIISVAHNFLAIEESMQGLLCGPWETAHYRKLWRTRVLKATDIAPLKDLLLILELNLRRVALSSEWMKPVDCEITVGSSTHILACSNDSKKSGGRKRSRKNMSEGKKKNVDAGGDFTSHTSGIYWWRGGRVSRQLFNWKMLPKSLAFKCGRQAGRQKIPGVAYSDASEFAKRSKYVFWRAAVEVSSSVASLICQVKDLHSNIKWNDLQNTQIFCSAKESKKQTKPLKSVKIRQKRVEGEQVNYVLDFGRRKNIPDIISKQALMHQETSSGRKKYWLNESVIPLGLLKAFEMKKLELEVSRLAKKLPAGEVKKCKIINKKRSQGFTYLFSKIQAIELRKCGQCNKDIPEREVATCKFCGGSFHRSHFNVPKGTTIAAYLCRACEEKQIKPKIEKQVKPKIVKPKIKKQVKPKIKKQVKSKIEKQVKPKIEKRKTPVIDTNGANASKSRSLSKPEPSSAGQNGKWSVKYNGKKSPTKVIFKQNSAVKSKKKTTKPKKGKKSQVDELKKDMNDMSLCRSRRTSTHLSYWLKGLLWSGKQESNRGIEFQTTKVLLPSMCSSTHVNPICALCHKEHNPALVYLSCEKCGDWFHGAAYEVTLENIKSVSGFRCHKCRSCCAPQCPLTRSSFVGKENYKEHIDVAQATSDVHLQEDTLPNEHDFHCSNSNLFRLEDFINDDQMVDTIQNNNQYGLLQENYDTIHMETITTDSLDIQESQQQNGGDAAKEFQQPHHESVFVGDLADENAAREATLQKEIVGDPADIELSSTPRLTNDVDFLHSQPESFQVGGPVDEAVAGDSLDKDLVRLVYESDTNKIDGGQELSENQPESIGFGDSMDVDMAEDSVDKNPVHLVCSSKPFHGDNDYVSVRSQLRTSHVEDFVDVDSAGHSLGDRHLNSMVAAPGSYQKDNQQDFLQDQKKSVQIRDSVADTTQSSVEDSSQDPVDEDYIHLSIASDPHQKDEQELPQSWQRSVLVEEQSLQVYRRRNDRNTTADPSTKRSYSAMPEERVEHDIAYTKCNSLHIGETGSDIQSTPSAPHTR